MNRPSSRSCVLALAFSIFGLVYFSGFALAHPGRTNASGCHNDNRTGGYHCHHASPSPPRNTTPRQPAPQRSTCGVIDVTERPAQVGFVFEDLDGDEARVVDFYLGEGYVSYNVYFPSTGKTLRIDFEPMYWADYLGGFRNSASYTVSWDGHHDEAETREQVGCDGRRSYAAALIRRLYF